MGLMDRDSDSYARKANPASRALELPLPGRTQKALEGVSEKSSALQGVAKKWVTLSRSPHRRLDKGKRHQDGELEQTSEEDGAWWLKEWFKTSLSGG